MFNSSSAEAIPANRIEADKSMESALAAIDDVLKRDPDAFIEMMEDKI